MPAKRTQVLVCAGTGCTIGNSGELITEFEKEIIRSYNSSKKCFDEAPEDDRDSLQLFAFICNLSFDIYVKKQIVEKLLDNFPDLLHSENTGVKKDSAKKKK